MSVWSLSWKIYAPVYNMLSEKFIGSCSLMYCEYTLTLLHTMVSFIYLRHLIHRRLFKKTMHSDALKIALAFEWKQSPLPSLTFPDKRYIFSYYRITLNCSTVFFIYFTCSHAPLPQIWFTCYRMAVKA